MSKKSRQGDGGIGNRPVISYRYIWSEADGEFVGLCDAFPSLSHLDVSPDASLAGIRTLTEAVIADMAGRFEDDDFGFTGDFKRY